MKAAEVRLSGGGAKSAFWRQLQADIYGVDACVTNSTAGSAYGAMIMGGVGAGVWKSVPEACDVCIEIAGRTKKNAKMVKEYNKLYAPFGNLYRSLKENFREIAAVHGWL